MPSDANTDKQNDNSQKKSEAEQKFKIRKKCILSCGIIFLLIAISIYAAAYFFLPVDSLEIRLSIFVFVVLAAMSIWFYSAMRIDTNWLSFVSSTIGFFGLFLAITFYPDQEFQRNLNIISFVGMVATLFFLLLYAFINASFFPSKNPDIRQSVDFVSNHFAVEVLFSTLIIGTLFGTIAFLYFNPDKDNSTFFGGIDIKNVALATAGLVTFFWAAKATKNKSIELEEKKQDGKRHDNEIAMAKQRDTAQLIAEASKLLSSESDAQKYAGLSFLNAVASDPKGPLRKEAFDLIADFITGATDVTTANKARLRAMVYADDLVENNPDIFFINEFIQISSPHAGWDYLNNIDINIKNLYVAYSRYIINQPSLLKQILFNKPNQVAFVDCYLSGSNCKASTIEINNISAWKCEFTYCKIKNLNETMVVWLYDRSREGYICKEWVPKKYWENGNLKNNKFTKCDFSDCLSWINVRSWSDIKVGLKDTFDRCYYYSGHAPKDFDAGKDSDLLIEITSKEQFEELFKEEQLPYSPPEDKE
ncbi:hypothetical protein [Bartonella apis]|uniref:hypothetical protein n=2 Tax=Bartonella apis TaxID=1686310 RepID=UPI002430C213|nr:hypothetical protein [Bartonella apis]